MNEYREFLDFEGFHKRFPNLSIEEACEIYYGVDADYKTFSDKEPTDRLKAAESYFEEN